jgi:hypothetical protein
VKSFKFSTSQIVVDIEGKTYAANFGDPDLQQDILNFSTELATVDFVEKLPEVFSWISERIHYFIARLLGEDAEREIFEGREKSVLDELLLFDYLNREINENAAVKELEATLGRFAPSQTK